MRSSTCDPRAGFLPLQRAGNGKTHHRATPGSGDLPAPAPCEAPSIQASPRAGGCSHTLPLRSLGAASCPPLGSVSPRGDPRQPAAVAPFISPASQTSGDTRHCHGTAPTALPDIKQRGDGGTGDRGRAPWHALTSDPSLGVATAVLEWF